MASFRKIRGPLAQNRRNAGNALSPLTKAGFSAATFEKLSLPDQRVARGKLAQNATRENVAPQSHKEHEGAALVAAGMRNLRGWLLERPRAAPKTACRSV
jgi:hypothetical protein